MNRTRWTLGVSIVSLVVCWELVNGPDLFAIQQKCPGPGCPAITDDDLGGGGGSEEREKEKAEKREEQKAKKKEEQKRKEKPEKKPDSK